MRRPRALRPGDRVAVVAPASPFSIEEFEAGLGELRRLGFEPVHSNHVFARELYLAGSPELRAEDLRQAWIDPEVAAVVAARGGYGSVQLLPLLDAGLFTRHTKAFIGYSDNTSLLTWLRQACGLVAFHGPMVEGRFAKGTAAYDPETFTRVLCRAEPAGEITHPHLEVFRAGEAAGELVGGTLTQLVSSLGTPFAFDPPEGCVLFVDEVSERPYRIDRMLTQLGQAGLLGRTAALVFNELPRCEEPGGSPLARDAVRRVLRDFPGPVLYGLPSGHTDGAMITLPLGVRARVVTAPRPALIVEEAAVS